MKQEVRKMLCNICKIKVRKAEAIYQKQRRQLIAKVAEPEVSGKIKIKK